MLHEFSRTELLIGKDSLEKLKQSRVVVFGIGGVGTYAVEGLVRSGVGSLTLVDEDCVCLTNINRQLIATAKTVGRPKVEVMKERILEINPHARVMTYQRFYTHETGHEFFNERYDYVIDAIDTVASKIDLVVRAGEKGIPIISSMGAGNKLNPVMLEVDDIYNTSVCPLAKIMRKELRSRGVKSLKVVYSKEIPIKPLETEESADSGNCICNGEGTGGRVAIRRQIPGSVSFVPSVAGLIMAGEVVKDLIKR